MTTISRSATRKIAAIKAKNLTCRVYTLDNSFEGRDCDPDVAWRALERHSARLVVDENGRYTVRVHGNCWYHLTETA